MKGLLHLLLLVALPATAATITGTVIQSGTTSGLSPMTLQAYDASGVLKSTATTDAAGHYSITLVAGTYRVLAFDQAGVFATSFYNNAESFDTSTPLTLTSAQTVSNVDFALVRGGLIAGSVMSTVGTLLQSITVAAYNPDGTRRGFTTTDAAGHYQLVLPPGTFKLAAYDDAENYLTAFYGGAGSFDTVAGIAVTAGQTVTANFSLARAAIITGTVTDAATGAPLANAGISIYSETTIYASALTDSSGHYRVLVAAGAYRVVLFDPAGVYAAMYYPDAESFDTSAVIAVAEGQTQAGIDARLMRAGRVAGQVTATSGAALAGITVAAFNSDGTTRGFTTTDSTGNFALVLPPGAYRFASYDTNLVYLRRFYPNETAFTAAPAWSVFPSQTTTLNFSLPPGAVVSGQVTTTTLAALPGITVAAYDPSGIVASTVTDSAGNYRLLLEAGTYRIAAFDTAYRFASAYGSAAVALGQLMANENFALVLGVHIGGNAIIDATGAPAVSVTVAAYDGGGFEASTTMTRADGSYDLVVPPGTYRFAAYDPLQRFTPSPLTQVYTLAIGQVSFGITLRLGVAIPARHHAAHH